MMPRSEQRAVIATKVLHQEHEPEVHAPPPAPGTAKSPGYRPQVVSLVRGSDRMPAP
jgi:hypothetical protein